jgi:hypothetical protein
MERRTPLTHLWRSLWAAAACWACALPAWSDQALVIVVRADSPIQALDALQVHKAFLGLTVTVDGNPLRPLINDSQPALHDAFLQHVVGSSEQNYRRRMLMLTLQQGRPAPPVHRQTAELIKALEADPHAITFMWQSSAAPLRQLKTVRVLWHD